MVKGLTVSASTQTLFQNLPASVISVGNQWGGSWYFGPGLVLAQGQSVPVGGTMTLVYQRDGNLVLNDNREGLLWSAQVNHTCINACYAELRLNGNLVLSDGLTPYWSSQTDVGHPTQLIISPQFPYVQISGL